MQTYNNAHTYPYANDEFVVGIHTHRIALTENGEFEMIAKKNDPSQNRHYEIRCKDTVFPHGDGTRMGIGQTYWYEFDVQVNSYGTKPWEDGWLILHQLWQHSPENPVFALHVKSNGQFKMVVDNDYGGDEANLNCFLNEGTWYHFSVVF